MIIGGIYQQLDNYVLIPLAVSRNSRIRGTKVLLKRYMIPFVCDWYAVVARFTAPR